MAEFAGYNMPISYSGIKQEHLCVRAGVGIFDVSHMGEFIIRGKQALDLIQKVTSNDASTLEIGDAQYSCLPNSTGGIVDDLLIYRLAEDQCSEGERAYMLVVNASNMQKDWDWIAQHNSFDTRMINISDQTALLAVQGPKAIEVLQKLTDTDLTSIPYYKFKKGVFAGVENVIISNTGYTGSGGFELYASADAGPTLWEAVMVAGATNDILPAGLGARDTLRLEKGYCLYGNDIDDNTSPLEAGLGWITKLKKGDFIGKNLMVDLKEKGLQKRLVGFVMDERGIPRHDYEIEDEEGNLIGKVTSGTQSPSLGKAIGLGYVQKGNTKAGSKIGIRIRNKVIPATVTKIPFV